MYSNGQTSNTKTPPPKLSATFLPGNEDNYHMPVISPIPQRSMPEMPEQIQQNLSKLELNSTNTSPAIGGTEFSSRNSAQDYGSNPAERYSTQSNGLGQNVRNSPRASPRVSPRASPRVSPNPGPQIGFSIPTQPLLSSEPFFPYIKNPPPNVPPRAEEKERILEAARTNIISCNDAEKQVVWAEDTLAYIETSIENSARMAEAGIGRPQTPPIEHRLKSDAFNIIDFLAGQHHPRAEFLKGTWLEFGKFDCPVDKPGAYRCFSTAARNGFGRAEYRVGMQFEETGEIEKALKHYKIGLSQPFHDPACYYRMGMMYLLGQKGQPQDIRLGLDYIKYSADNADENAPQGSYVYGMLLARELPQVTIPEDLLKRDLKQAKYYLEKAAYLGFSKAQTRIATAYELQQLGLDFDPVYSLHYNLLAARQGEPEAEMAISKWFLSGYEGLFPKNEAVAYEYALRAAKAGFPTAEFAMGYFNEVGIHVPTNLVEAKYWYGQAAEHGNEDAKGRITGISRSKTLSRKDHDNMALAKIKSVRGRPNAAQQQNLKMPMVDTYRQSSPAPSRNDYQRNDPYQKQVQPSVVVSSTSYQQTPPNAMPSNINSGGHGATASNMRPPPLAYSQKQPLRQSSQQPVSASPALAPYSSRQSSLPQGYRVSSLGPPTGSNTGSQNVTPSLHAQNAPNSNSSYLSPQSGNRVPPKPVMPVDIGYSAPADLSGADRRRVASNPGAYGSIQASNRPPTASVPARKPAPSAQSSSANPRPVTTLTQPRPIANALASSPAPTPPPKTLSQPPGRTPGKGPSTFAEMGIPQAKQESDCIVM